MGVPASKYGQEIEQEKPTQGSLPSTPILTPKTRLIDFDPRSPSENIIRTPIEVLLTKNKKTLLLKSTESSPLENSTDSLEINSPGIKLKNIDPRSPTVDFERTPIVVPENDVTLPIKLHNKNLDNVRRTLLNTPLTKRSSEKGTPPKLLESNVITSKPIEYKRKSYVGLLETNLDFVETDLDTVKAGVKIDSEDGFSNISKELKKESKSQNKVAEEYSTPVKETTSGISNNLSLDSTIDPRSPTIDFVRTPIQILQKFEALEIGKVSIKAVTCNTKVFTDCDEDGDGLKTPIKAENVNKDNDNCETQSKAETVKDFDKKLSNLIYEDKESGTTVRNKKLGEVKSRTPLGTRNLNANPKKGISKLKVHDKPRKSSREFSRIPIFQNKKGKGKFAQCENTPPRNLEDGKKLSKQQWDPDNTLII